MLVQMLRINWVNVMRAILAAVFEKSNSKEKTCLICRGQIGKAE